MKFTNEYILVVKDKINKKYVIVNLSIQINWRNTILNKDILSEKQGIFIFIVFLIATSTNIITGASAKNDLWISIIISFLVVLPIAMIGARLCDLFPGKDLYDIFCFREYCLFLSES